MLRACEMADIKLLIRAILYTLIAALAFFVAVPVGVTSVSIITVLWF